MKQRAPLLLFLAALVGATGCRSHICPWCGHDIRIPPPAGMEPKFLPPGEVQGIVTSLERGELHPLANVTVQLHDVTLRAGEDPKLVAETRIERPQSLPVAFRIAFPENTIDATRDYLLSAKLMVESSVLFETDTRYPVLTHGAPTRVELVLARRKQP